MSASLGRGLAILMLLLTGTSALAQPNEAARVRVLLVLDTLDKQGPAWSLDGDNMKAILEATTKKLGLDNRVTVNRFTGAAVSPTNILNYYRALDTGPNETLVFYYSGHGGYHGKKGHFLALTLGQLFRNDLITAMKTKNPRLVVLMTDCCANVVPDTGALFAEPPRSSVTATAIQGPLGRLRARREEPIARTLTFQPPPRAERPRVLPDPTLFIPPAEQARIEEPPHTVRQLAAPGAPGRPRAKFEAPQSDEPQRPPVILRTAVGSMALDDVIARTNGEPLRHLLFRHRGLVDLNGCEKGELSNGTTYWGGSLFTIAFLHLQTEGVARFDSNFDGLVEWSEFFPLWRNATEATGRRISQDRLWQSPAAFQLKVEPVR